MYEIEFSLLDFCCSLMFIINGYVYFLGHLNNLVEVAATSTLESNEESDGSEDSIGSDKW